MTDTNLLREAIKRSGYRVYYIANSLGVSYPTLQKKIEGRGEFYACEIEALTKLLKLTQAERDRIFFAPCVAETATNN